jgi:predicted phage tail component-like protein
MFSINFNNKNSFDDFGLIVERRPIIPIPKRRIEQITVAGRNGSLTQDEGTYEDIEIPVEFALVDRENVYERARLIKSWLMGSGSLVISDDADRLYKVKFIRLSDIDRFMVIVGRFTATFVCEPFTYSTNDEPIILTSPTTIYNPGTHYSDPYIKITGTGDITLTINGTPITLTGVDTYIELDSDIGECYKANTPLNNKMTGDFPKLQPEDNTITWTGTVSKIDLVPRWRWI